MSPNVSTLSLKATGMSATDLGSTFLTAPASDVDVIPEFPRLAITVIICA
jgi:hypothetical protein